jgi:biofilm PGA synthesis N-glycosyltransferase PgaC
MLTDWISWLCSVPQTELLLLLCPIFLFDTPRYLFGSLAMWIWDFIQEALVPVRGKELLSFDYCPSVCVVVAGLNEADGLERGLANIWGSYPRLEIIVVDDGSSDGMSQVAQDFAKSHSGVRVVTKRRGGKSGAMNTALPLTKAEVIVIVDADSGLARDAIWEIVQPLTDPKVGAVSGSVLVRNSQRNLLTRIQSFEYLRSILLGRMLSSRLGVLGIISGAFGAFRRSALDRVGGWDGGPGEDEDIVLRLRKVGYAIEFAPYAECYTDVPESLKVLTKQRRRWEWAVITFESRKHIDMANPRNANFQWSNLMLFIERWVFNMFLPLWFWVYLLFMVMTVDMVYFANLSVAYYLIFATAETLLWLIVLYYSNNRARDIRCFWILPILPFYQMMQRCVTSWALLEEMLTRRSFSDSFVPAHVRRTTWKW